LPLNNPPLQEANINQNLLVKSKQAYFDTEEL
jgi:hypothetical protein